MRFSTRIFRLNGLFSDVQQLCFFKLKQKKNVSVQKWSSFPGKFPVPTWSQGINKDNVMSHETKLDRNHAMQLMIKISQNITVIYYTARRIYNDVTKREMTDLGHDNTR